MNWAKNPTVSVDISKASDQRAPNLRFAMRRTSGDSRCWTGTYDGVSPITLPMNLTLVSADGGRGFPRLPHVAEFNAFILLPKGVVASPRSGFLASDQSEFLFVELHGSIHRIGPLPKNLTLSNTGAANTI